MFNIYYLLSIGARIVYKIRHFKGHGIHSPFVFSLITEVIDEKNPFYAYFDIEQALFNTKSNCSIISHKRNKLLLRLVERFSVKNILILGGGEGETSLYLTAPASDIDCFVYEASNENKKRAKKLYSGWNRNIMQIEEERLQLKKNFDCIFIDLKYFNLNRDEVIEYLLVNVTKNSFIIIDGIRTNKESQALWKTLIVREEVSISLDLYHLGILFFNKKYKKQNYKLSF